MQFAHKLVFFIYAGGSSVDGFAGSRSWTSGDMSLLCVSCICFVKIYHNHCGQRASSTNAGKMPEYLEYARKGAYNHYMTYLESFGSDEVYLRKKVECELGTKMIHLKMRCSGIDSNWGKVRSSLFKVFSSGF